MYMKAANKKAEHMRRSLKAACNSDVSLHRFILSLLGLSTNPL